MSNRQKQAHQEKVDKRQRLYPLLTGPMIEERMGALLVAMGIIQEEVMELNNPANPMPDERKSMWLAHLTIAHYIGEQVMAKLDHDLQLIAKQADIVTLTSPLVDVRGKPIA